MEHKIKLAYKRGYRITDDGFAVNPKGKLLPRKNIDSKGYFRFKMRHDNKSFEIEYHRLLAYQMFGDKIFEPGIVVRHLDGNKENCTKQNILTGTEKENALDIPKELRVNRAIHATSFVKKHNHKSILNYYNKVKSYRLTMMKFNLSSKSTLHYIIKNALNN